MATQIATSIPSKRLSVSILSSDTSMVLNNIRSWKGLVDGATNLTSADFGTRAFAVLRNSTNTQMELIEFDPTTIANTAVTIIARGLSYSGGTVANATTAYNWNANETIVELGSHTPQLFEQYTDKTSDETIAGIKTFSSLPATTAGNPIADTDLVRKAYADSLANSTTRNYVVIAGTAGETLVAGNVVYLKSSDNRWWKASSAAAATAENVILGIAQGAGAAAGAITSGVLLYGLDSNQSGLTANTLYYLSTGGAISTSTGTKVVQLGFSTSTTAIFFMPNFDRYLTKDQQLALAGDNTDIAVGSGNKYVTQTGLQKQVENYAADSGSANAYVVTLAPVPTSYAAGMIVRMKAGFANTASATINVNSLGAKTIKKTDGATNLISGDIANGQLVVLVYDGTNFQMTNPVANAATSYFSGTTTKNDGDSSTTQNIAHGLGKTPRYVRIKAVVVASATVAYVSEAVYNGTTQSSLSYVNSGGNLSISTAGFYLGDTNANGASNGQAGVITFDGTNIIITWTKNGTPSGSTYTLLCEAYA